MRKIIATFMMLLCAVCMASAANYLTFTAEEDGSTFGIVNQRNNPDVQYSLDGGETWTALAAGDTITLAHKGEKALLRGDNPEGFSKDYEIYSSFTMTGKIAASGSVMSLIDNTGETLVVPAACFCRLFEGCTSLTQAPALPATTLAEACYSFMFSGCTSLTQAPELPATTLVGLCYNCIFVRCESLSQIRVSFDEWSDAFTGDWAVSVAPTGTFICPKALPLEYGDGRIPEGWTVKYIDDTVAAETNYLTFTAEEDGSTFGIVNNGKNNPDIQYSLDGGETWTALAAGDTITLAHKGEKALLRGDNPEGFSKDYEIYSSFTMTGKIAASGSVMSLIDNTGETLVVPAAACFCKLFYGCTSLTQAPELPATTLAGDCYLGMFRGCTSLTQAPALPATTLAEGCCARMFDGCTSLTQAPELPATTLLESCYAYMFSGCTSLSEIKVSFDDWDYGMGTRSWVEPVAPTGTFYCPKALPLEYGVNRIPEGWTVKYIDDTVAVETNYLTFTAEEDGSSFGIVNNGYNNPDLQYSLDGGETWNALAAGDTITLAHKGDKALLRGDNPEGFSKGHGVYSSFTMTGKIAASGSVMSLNDGVGISTEVPVNFCFYKLFQGCTSLTQAPELPATILKDDCYADMFSGCTSLTEVPELPATALIDNCYNSMFKNCTGLTRAYLLFVDMSLNVRLRCLSEMFSGCTNLSEISVAFDEWSGYTQYWVYNVAPTGTFYCPKALPLEYGVSRIPEGWTVKYIDDTVAAETNYLTFTAEEDGSSFGIVNNGGNNPDVQYSLDGGKTWTALSGGEMVTLTYKGDKALLRGDNPEGFSNGYNKYSSFTMTGKIAASGSVMSLIDGVGLSTKIPSDFCFYVLFYNCTSLTQAPALPATTLAVGCYQGMFDGCTSLLQAPELPATNLENSSYGLMFSGCTSLSEINVSFEDWDYGMGTEEWVKDVAPTGTFICPKALALEYGWESIPEGWTVKYIDDTVAVETNYLTFTAEEDGSSFGIVNNGGNNPDIQYSLDGGETWTALAAGDTITLAHKGEKALLRGDNPEGFSKDYEIYSSFTMTGKIAASGSVMSLIDGVGLSTEIPNNYCFRYLFSGCASLTQAPALPATILTEDCYDCMFKDCTGLTQAPALPAMTMYESCYDNMFSGCTSLTQAPELPAMTLDYRCYGGMFRGCTSLTQAPELPATELSRLCYDGMFLGCTSLTQAPELPATTLTEGCYESMFKGCASLTQAPALPATKMAYACYSAMFLGCTSLTRAPELPAATFSMECYDAMFYGCTNLSRILVSFDDWNVGYCTSEWVKDVAPTGTFICPKGLPLEYGVSRIPEGWTVKYIDDTVAVETNYLTFTAEEDGSSFGIVNKDNNPDVQYSLDGGETWTALAAGDTITLAHKGDKALLRGNNPEGFSKDWNQFSTLKMTGKVAASGSVMSLIDGVGLSTEVPGNYCFYKLFQGCTSLTQAPELPATTLAYSCYRDMFEGCTSLTQAPKLPATTLAEACYFGMFADCTSLTQAPELPATTLPTTSNVENGCYSLMFLGCTSLTQAPELPATTLAEGCYADMFYGCTSLTQAPKLPATTLSDFCYFEMFSGCTSLTQAPELPATTLEEDCYRGMFNGCKSLSEINVSFATWSDYYRSTAEWVKDVAPTGTFICPKALALEYGISRIPEGWTVKYIEGEGSGVNTTLANNITVWSDDLTIYVRGAKGEVSIYDLSGKRVAVSYSADEERALSVPAKGVYVVRTNNGTSDVLVR